MKQDSACASGPLVKNLSDLAENMLFRDRLRSFLRKTALFLLSLPARISVEREWIIFPYYHHVLDDERTGFNRQLRYMRRFGEFVSLDDAVEILQRPERLGGRYFCITFDDGFRSGLVNAVPILVDHKCPAAFFVPTDWLGDDTHREPGRQPFGSVGKPLFMEVLTWEDCRQMMAAGMAIGSHTCGHVHSRKVDQQEYERQLRESKARIEQVLGKPCHHFACPWGRPNLDFEPSVHPQLARRVGYRSFLTTLRGPNHAGSDPFMIRRDHTLAADRPYVLQYFFSRE